MTSIHLIAGVDEVGRGPLAGPVVAAAVILDPAQPISGLADSKKLSGIAGAHPVAINTVIVSPIARPIPNIQAAIIPERAAGIFTRITVCHLVAPKASEA